MKPLPQIGSRTRNILKAIGWMSVWIAICFWAGPRQVPQSGFGAWVEFPLIATLIFVLPIVAIGAVFGRAKLALCIAIVLLVILCLLVHILPQPAALPPE